MAAVIELAVACVDLDVGHQACQVHRVNVVQTELLKSWRINHGSGFCRIHPIQAGTCGGVLARIQGGGNLVGEHVRVWQQAIDERAFAGARGAEHQCRFSFHELQQHAELGGVQSLCFGLERQGDQGVAHVTVNGEPIPRPPEGACQITFVQGNDGLDALRFRCNQGA